ncbi:MAG TPA: hypothetical protein VK660_08440 [Xanthomonadaceae bacterium]|nr:hypothetical protein [Xanthomonadaceae bacterium]
MSNASDPGRADGGSCGSHERQSYFRAWNGRHTIDGIAALEASGDGLFYLRDKVHGPE